MPELKEVFEMATKEVEPDVDMRREQEKRQRRVARNRRLGAFAVAAAIGTAAIVLVLNTDDTTDGRGAVPAEERSPVAPVIEPGFVLYDLATGDMTSTGIVGAGSAVDVSSDGTKIAYAGSGNGLGATVHVANVDGSDIQEFAGTDVEGDATAPRWSPDGTKIVFQEKPLSREIGNVYVLDVTTGRVDRITDLDPTKAGWYYMAPTFSADGDTVVFMKQNRDDGEDGLRWDLWSVPATGGEPTIFARNASGADFSPSGDAVAFSEAGGAEPLSGDLYVAQPDGGGARKVADGPAEMPRWSPDGSRIAWWSGDGAYVMDLQTGDTQRVSDVDGWVEWVDGDTWMIEAGVD